MVVGKRQSAVPLAWTLWGTFTALAGWGALFGTPCLRLGIMTIGLLLLLKSMALLENRRIGWAGAGLFIFAWPGVNPKPFEARQKVEEDARLFAGGLWRFLLGLVLCAGLAIVSRQIPSIWVGWLGLAFLILTCHLGIGIMLPIVLRACGWPVRDLFQKPWKSSSLFDFWSNRWNLAFIEMNRIMVLAPARRVFGRKHAVWAAFLLSGLFHELAISYPANSGWGLPFSYFAIQAAAMWIEHRWRLRSRIFLWLMFFLPLPLLFHAGFRATCIEPLFYSLADGIRARPLHQWFDFGLWVLPALQLLVLAASFQVPTRLHWKEELPRLSALNRKMMWSSSGYIVLNIAFFASSLLLLHGDFLSGTRVAGVLALFAFVFWAIRLVLDRIWLKAEDWPQGAYFRIGHALLSALFLVLTISYGGLSWYCLSG